MIPSPRKSPRASSTTAATFNQTWDEKDVVSFDPNAMPVAKIPRGWERKPQIIRVAQGKEKKIWRRHNLRSRANNISRMEQDAEVEEQDAQSRAVKRRQHLSPKAMEKTTAVLNGTKRAFRATRWDRRKSVLPRKKAACIEDPMVGTQGTTENGINDAHNLDKEDESFTDLHVSALSEEHQHSEAPMSSAEDSKSEFTFSMDADKPDELLDCESIDERDDADLPTLPTTEDATLTNPFCSPAKCLSADHIESSNEVFYPQLPLSHGTSTEPEARHEGLNDEESKQASESDNTEDTSMETSILSDAIIESVEVGDTLNEPNFKYPALSVDSMVHDDTENEQSGSEMSDSRTTPQSDDESLDMGSPRSPGAEERDSVEDDENFTEASLQLDIQRQCDEQSPLLEEKQDCEAETTEASLGITIAAVGTAGAETPETEGPPEVPASHEETIPLSSPEASNQHSLEPQAHDITDGLTLSFTPVKSTSADPAPRKLHSPPPPCTEFGPDDVTMTMAIDDDTAILKDFLTRAAANKAEKAATHRRESLQNRRDSDVVRNALASPRKVLEDKDPNSPSKYDAELTLDLSQTLTFSLPSDLKVSPTPAPAPADEEGGSEEQSLRASRRSSRAKRSRLPAPASSTPVAAQPHTSKINIRRTDGTDVVILKKSDAQELSTLTRSNTRKNKQGAFCVTVRLFKLAADAASLPPIDDATKELVVGKNVRWDETLAYYQENPETLAEAESLSTPDELSLEPASTPRTKSKISKSSTPKLRRARTVNGTPAKGLLTPASLLPEALHQEKEPGREKETLPSKLNLKNSLSRPKTSRSKKLQIASTAPAATADLALPSLDVAPVGVTATLPARKSRLAAPRKVVLPPSGAGAGTVLDGKENALSSTGAGGGITTGSKPEANTSLKKSIPVPRAGLMSSTASAGSMGVGVGVESGLPRRRGRKY